MQPDAISRMSLQLNMDGELAIAVAMEVEMADEKIRVV